MGRVLAVMVVLALTGCTVPSSTSVVIPSYSPVREALSYFPESAPLVAVVRTDAQDPGLRRLAASGALAPLRRAAAARGLFYKRWSMLFGNPAVIGVPHIGSAPLAVLATDDRDRLEALASARVAAGRARFAGGYRGADVYAEKGWAFAVRDRVVLVGGSPRDLFGALDVRSEEAGFEAAQLNDVLADDGPPATFLRAYVNLAAVVAGAGATARDVPVLQALDRGGISIGATAEELRGVLIADTSAEGLTSDDLPPLTGAAAGRPVVPPDAVALAVADLAPFVASAERALRAALPVSVLQLDALRARLRGAGVELTPDLLAGPAVITDAPALRLQPRRPALVREAVARAARRLELKPRDGMYVTRGVRFGFVGRAFVAGRAPAAALRRLANAPSASLRGPLSLRVPRLGRWFARPVEFTLAGSPERLVLQAYSGF